MGYITFKTEDLRKLGIIKEQEYIIPKLGDRFLIVECLSDHEAPCTAVSCAYFEIIGFNQKNGRWGIKFKDKKQAKQTKWIAVGKLKVGSTVDVFAKLKDTKGLELDIDLILVLKW